tara:strand:- start:922 stop:1266 length:345 start_codon:yes stop_codon:yes gene_type:complete
MGSSQMKRKDNELQYKLKLLKFDATNGLMNKRTWDGGRERGKHSSMFERINGSVFFLWRELDYIKDRLNEELDYIKDCLSESNVNIGKTVDFIVEENRQLRKRIEKLESGAKDQ